MKRTCLAFLNDWLTEDERKPLVIRGARQVGKTWLVRHLAESQKKRLVEVNFERSPQWTSLFLSNDPRQILLNLGAALNETIDPKTYLLPNTTMFHPRKSSDQAMNDLKTICRNLQVKLEKAVAVKASEFVGF